MIWHKVGGGRKCPGDTALFLYLNDHSMSVGRYSIEKGGWIMDDNRTKPAVVTHWAYIKRPPKHFRNKIKRWWHTTLLRILRGGKDGDG